MEHDQEPIYFDRFIGVADIPTGFSALTQPDRVGNEHSLAVQESEERQPGRSAQADQKLMAARSVEQFLLAFLLNRDVDRHEVLLDNRLDFRGLDEPIELLAPSSPGCVKDREDGTVTLSCLAFRFIEDGRGGGRLLRDRNRRAEQDSDQDRDRSPK